MAREFLNREAQSMSKLLKGKVVRVCRRPRTGEVVIEFTDGIKLFVDAKSEVEVSITGGAEGDKQQVFFKLPLKDPLRDEVQKVLVSYKDAEIEIMGNRGGLRYLGEVCLRLSELSDEEATAANHYHFQEGLDSTTAEGSVPMLVTVNVEL